MINVHRRRIDLAIGLKHITVNVSTASIAIMWLIANDP
jgi:hypothetical protein